MKRNLTLLTDFYELTMMNGYLSQGTEDEIAIFDVFFRQNVTITYSIACGLEQAVDYVMSINFADEEIEYLRGLNVFDEKFLDALRNFKFSGDIYSVPEGTVVFPGEPILTVKAPIFQAQLIETALLNIINHQTLIATKAAKVCYAAQNGNSVMEFGLRRAQGPDAGIYGARASFIGGCGSTSNVLAGKMFDIPVSGTMAHSWVMSFPDEFEAFKAYAETYPKNAMLLVDTYDVLNSGVPNAIKLFDYMKKKDPTFKAKGIRIDSGDFSYLSKQARKMLDEAGHTEALICASGDLDEKSITSLINQGAKIDLWGIGTKLITSENMPSLGGVYKLACMTENGELVPKIKRSNNDVKITNPGFKNFYRIFNNKTKKAEADLIYLRDEGEYDASRPLTITHSTERWKQSKFEDYTLIPMQVEIVKDGKIVYDFPKLTDIKEYAKSQLDGFWDEYKRLDNPHIYKVDLSDKLYNLKQELLKRSEF